MKKQLQAMLDMQDATNSKIHPRWIEQDYAWYRAVWIECGELMDHYGYKWWKQQHCDEEQVRLEVVDIWHFGMSALFEAGVSSEAIADELLAALETYRSTDIGVREATEALAGFAITHKGFSVRHFWALMEASGMSFDDLYSAYIGKNVLNFFRQDHGYKDGSYIKQWAGREDNEHLVELVSSLDCRSDTFRDDLYHALQRRYDSAAVNI